ncbi:MAG: LON peptidase substrate-binding domain-containing protein [Opitutales bacterium]
MNSEIEIPAEVPVMTLSETVLFPQAMMPLYIFEPRYRQMLADVLAETRIFAVASLKSDEAEAEFLETPCPIAGVGVVRACKQNPDGTSNLILQGLARVQFEAIVAEEPYRRARISQVISESEGSEKSLQAIQPKLMGLLKTQIRLGAGIPKEMLQFLCHIKEPENLLDLAIFALCSSSKLQQRLLETRSVLERFNLFENFLCAQIEQLKLDRMLKGGLDNDQVGNN